METNFLTYLNQGQVILFDGAMGTMLYHHGVFFNRCYEEINLSSPQLVETIHRAYVTAGCDVIETNTFGANRIKLTQFGLDDQVYAINRRGAEIALRCAGEDVWVAGSIGPLGALVFPKGKIQREEAVEYFREQAMALRDGGVDLFILETFRDIEEIEIAVEAVRQVSDLPLIASVTFTQEGPTDFGISPEKATAHLNSLPVEGIGINCAIGPKPMMDILSRMIKVAEKPVSVMPNAGYPQLVSDRLFYSTTPEYFAEYARRYIQLGARIIGGCCGSTPEHIAMIKQGLSLYRKMESVAATAVCEEPEQIESETVGFCSKNLEDKSRLGQMLGKKFLVSVEISPPRGADLSDILEKISFLKSRGVDAINIPDGPRASARMNPMAMATIIKQCIDIETIWHYTCRDKSLIGIQADLLGAEALGLRNILIVTGDPPKLGDFPNSTGVFDVDSIGLVKIVSNLNKGLDLAGNQLQHPASFVIGVGANPAAVNLDEELDRTIRKIKQGAEFILTQPVYEIDRFKLLLDAVREYSIPVLVGIMPLTSYKMAEFMHNEVPGMSIPLWIREKLQKAASKEEARDLGFSIARDTLAGVRDWVQGTYIMMPAGNHRHVGRILEGLTD